MQKSTNRSNLLIGAGLAIFATIIWSGNFIVARGVIHEIPPVTLAFFRWLTASIFMVPFAWKQIRNEWPLIKKHFAYLFWISLSGITLFNTFIYVAGHYSPAINLALIGTTSSPIMSVILARFFLKEKVRWQQVFGLTLCITGILYLLSKGSLESLVNLRFGKGDILVLFAALTFAIYNVLAKRKPSSISPQNFLFTIFSLGTILLLPAVLVESNFNAPVAWNAYLGSVIIYLGLGASVISYLCWNSAIGKLGAARTALFGNLIPIFSSVEALWLLKENITSIHLLSGSLVIAGLLIANIPAQKKIPQVFDFNKSNSQ